MRCTSIAAPITAYVNGSFSSSLCASVPLWFIEGSPADHCPLSLDTATARSSGHNPASHLFCSCSASSVTHPRRLPENVEHRSRFKATTPEDQEPNHRGTEAQRRNQGNVAVIRLQDQLNSAEGLQIINHAHSAWH